MADTRREQILAALKTRLAAIAPPTYETAAGSHVFEWPAVELSEEDELPAIVVRDGDCTVERETNAQDIHKLTVSIECLGRGTTAPAEVRKIMGDVIEAIGVDVTFGGIARDTNLIGHRLAQMSQEDRRLGGGEVLVEIEYESNHMNPFGI